MIARFRIGALVLLLLSLPLGRLNIGYIGPVPVSLVTMLTLVLLAIWLWRILVGGEKFKSSLLQLPLALFLIWAAIGVYSASDSGLAIHTFLIFVMGAALYLAAYHTVRSAREVTIIMWAVAVTAGSTGLYAVAATILQLPTPALSTSVFTSGEETYSRVQGLFTHPNYLGGFLALAVPPTVALAASETSWLRATLGNLLAGAAIAGIVLAYSRGAYIGVLIALLILLLTLRKGSSWLLTTATIAGAAAFAATLGAFRERVGSIATAQSESGISTRLEAWAAVPTLVREHPLIGVGLGNFGAVYADLLGAIPAPYRLPWYSYHYVLPFPVVLPHAHNVFFTVAVEMGLVGIASFLSVLMLAFWRVLQVSRLADRKVRSLGLGLGAGLIALLVQNLADTTFYQGFIVLLFFTFLGLLDTMVRLEGSAHVKEEVNNEPSAVSTPSSNL
jgi:O-antigen ligase